MKKNTMIAIANFIANVPEMTEQYNEIMAELNRDETKRIEKRAIYDTVKDIILNALDKFSTPITVTELYKAIENSVPAEFTKGKLQYALTNELYPEINKIAPTATRGVYTYMRA